jgi:hypothetical protein
MNYPVQRGNLDSEVVNEDLTCAMFYVEHCMVNIPTTPLAMPYMDRVCNAQWVGALSKSKDTRMCDHVVDLSQLSLLGQRKP